MSKEILVKENIKLNQSPVSREDAILKSGNMLLEKGYVDKEYVESMLKRDENLSVYLGNYLALPHGEFEAKDYIKTSGMSVLIYPEGIDWHGDTVKVVIGLAGRGDDHMEILSNLADIFSDDDNIEKIIHSQSVDEVYELLVN